jgi:hypothetical protein
MGSQTCTMRRHGSQCQSYGCVTSPTLLPNLLISSNWRHPLLYHPAELGSLNALMMLVNATAIDINPACITLQRLGPSMLS